jgi:uncharacterized membrane protein YagU involved in acid resistance
MASQRGEIAIRRPSTGDAAVDGLFSGLGAGILMAGFLVFTGLLAQNWPGDVLSRFSAGVPVSPITGLFSHLAVSGIYGIFFGVFYRLVLHSSGLSGWLCGALYGVLLFLLAHFVVLPGTGSSLQDLPISFFALSHLVYGLALGEFMDHQRRAIFA